MVKHVICMAALVFLTACSHAGTAGGERAIASAHVSQLGTGDDQGPPRVKGTLEKDALLVFSQSWYDGRVVVPMGTTMLITDVKVTKRPLRDLDRETGRYQSVDRNDHLVYRVSAYPVTTVSLSKHGKQFSFFCEGWWQDEDHKIPALTCSIKGLEVYPPGTKLVIQ